MAARPLKRKAESALWEAHKETLKELYVNQGLGIEEVRQKMAAEHNFVRPWVLQDLARHAFADIVHQEGEL